jgi:hypothetical protein
VHSVNFAAKLVHTRRALSSAVIDSHQQPVSDQACNPLDPHWFLLFAVEELYGTRYQSGSFSLINVRSGSNCLRNFVCFIIAFDALCMDTLTQACLYSLATDVCCLTHLHRHVCTRWQLLFAAILPWNDYFSFLKVQCNYFA